MVEDLEADPEIMDRFQFWTYGYSTGDPILYSASLLRRDMEEVRRKFDPAGTDAAFDRIVVVGHSLGGLLAKMMVQDSGDRLWRITTSDRPSAELGATRTTLASSAAACSSGPDRRSAAWSSSPRRTAAAG